jgi:hypothetical protein
MPLTITTYVQPTEGLVKAVGQKDGAMEEVEDNGLCIIVMGVYFEGVGDNALCNIKCSLLHLRYPTLQRNLVTSHVI